MRKATITHQRGRERAAIQNISLLKDEFEFPVNESNMNTDLREEAYRQLCGNLKTKEKTI